ncbi:discoidin domain-containing protein [Pedobacter sp. N36a]|uniref:discoidin domain-containing protein n=1 Tax=Pedobacter sp. N36a TaxID=2767996 RepID=UPI0016576647|nr:discoidin domain-containing protein [Pedobacter sp. N36a]MBC8988009.1 discoidin domain-containing protein [Pedobacter sp. N36a]
MKKPIRLALVVLFLFAVSCKKNTSVSVEYNDTEQSQSSVDTLYTSIHPYNLNVVYFIPSDVNPNEDYQRRLSKILIDGQAFFKKWMVHWGYGERTFGLLKDDEKQLVKIITIRGQAAQGNGWNYNDALIKAEVDQYFQNNPEEMTSKHILIVTATNETDPDRVQNFVKMPFHGSGATSSWPGYCFALDYPGMDANNLGQAGAVGFEAMKWIGGLLHELGHAMNAGHSGEKASEKNDPSMGTSLMGGGNYTYGAQPTFLTHSSCASFIQGQLFSTITGTFYADPNLITKRIYAKYENGNIIVSGRFKSGNPVNEISFNHIPSNNSGGYTAPSWVTTPIGVDSFSVSMPINEIREKNIENYVLSVIVNHQNGARSGLTFPYKYINNIPSLDFGVKTVFNRANWTVVLSSEESANSGYKLFDNNAETFWHSRWASPAANFPHYIEVDMKAAKTIHGFYFVQRDYGRRLKDIEILTSINNLDWVNLGQFQLQNYNGGQSITLPTNRLAQYFKIIITSNHDSGGSNACLSEIGAF